MANLEIETVLNPVNIVSASTSPIMTIRTTSAFDIVYAVKLDANFTISLSTTNTSRYQTCTLIMTQDSTGNRTVTWPSNTSWAAGSAPTITATANHTDIIRFHTYDGVNFIGVVTGQNIYGTPWNPALSPGANAFWDPSVASSVTYDATTTTAITNVANQISGTFSPTLGGLTGSVANRTNGYGAMDSSTLNGNVVGFFTSALNQEQAANTVSTAAWGTSTFSIVTLMSVYSTAGGDGARFFSANHYSTTDATSNSIRFQRNGSTNNLVLDWNNSEASIPVTGITYGAPLIIAATWQTGAINLWVNGTQYFSSTTGTSSTSAVITTTPNFTFTSVAFGRNDTNNNGHLQGAFAGAVVQNGVMSTLVRQKNEGWWAQKYNVTLPSSHPYFSTPPTA